MNKRCLARNDMKALHRICDFCDTIISNYKVCPLVLGLCLNYSWIKIRNKLFQLNLIILNYLITK